MRIIGAGGGPVNEQRSAAERLTGGILADTLPSVSDGKLSTPHTSTRGQRIAIGAAIIVFALVSAYLALVIVTRVDSLFSPTKQITIPHKVGDVLPLPGVDKNGESGPQDPINILVMGLDRRPREGDIPTRTDSMFVVTVDPKLGAVGILGIPRDLYVDIPGRYGGTYQDRINTVYVVGELNGYSQGGMGLLKEVLDNDLGIEIDKYVIVDFQGFEKIIDGLGGIDVDVPEEVYDPYYSETELPGDYDPQHFYPGLQHMDGSTALAYSRIRFSSDDLDRIQRQQRVIFAVMEKAQSLDVLKNALSLWEEYKNTIQTDISDLQIPGYAALAADVKDNVHAVSLGPATVPYTTREGAQVLVGNKEKIQEIVDSLFDRQQSDGSSSSPDEETAPVRVQVQNATGSDGLASRVVEFIASKGYPPNDLNAANVFDGASHNVSEILDLNGESRQQAYLLAKWLDLPAASVRDATADERAALEGTNADVVIILGNDVDFDRLIQSPTTSVAGG